MANDAIGFEVIINDNLLKKVELADEKIKQLGKTTEQVSKQMITAFTQIGTQGLDALIQKVKSVQDNVSNIKIDSSNTKKSGKELIAIFEKINQIINTSTNKNADLGLSNIGVRIEELRKQLQKAREDIDLFRHAIGTGKKTYIEFGVKGLHEAEEQAESLMRQIDALEHTKERLGKKGSIGELTGDSFEDEKQKRKINALNEYYRELEKTSKKEAELREKALKEEEKRRKEETRILEQELKKQERIAEQSAKQQSKQRKRDYDFTMKTQDTYSHTMSVSNRAKSINQEIQAIKLLEQERNKLKKTDADYENKLKSLNKEIIKHKQSIDLATEGAKQLSGSHKNLLNISDQLQRRLALIFSVSQVTGYVKKLASVRGEFELQQRSLQAIIGNKDKANEVFDKVTKLAVQSPFQLKDLVTYTKQLAAYKIETNKLYDSTKMLADISAGVGVDMSRMVLAYGQVASANYLRGTELRQFSEAGVNILDGLAEYFTELKGRVVEVDEVFDMVSRRMVRFEHVDEVLRRMTQSGGEFYNMQAIQAQTLKGQISNLQDSIDVMLNDIGQDNEGVLKGVVATIRSLVENWRYLQIAIEEAGLGLAIIGIVNGFKQLQEAMFLLRAAETAQDLQNIATKGNLVTRVLARIKVAINAITAHPIIAIITAVSAGLYAIYKYNKAVEEQNKVYDDNSVALYNQIRVLKQQQEQYHKAGEAIKQAKKDIEENAENTEKLQEAQSKLLLSQREQSKVLSKLKSEYPEIYNQVIQNKDSQEQWAKAIEETNKQLLFQMALEQGKKGNSIHDDFNKNVKDAIESLTEFENKYKEVQSTTSDEAINVELKYKEGLISEKDYNRFKEIQNDLLNVKNIEDYFKFAKKYGKEISSFYSSKAPEFGIYSKEIRAWGKAVNKAMREAYDAYYEFNKDFSRLNWNLDNQKDSIKNEWLELGLTSADLATEEGQKSAMAFMEGIMQNFGIENNHLANKVKEWIENLLDVEFNFQIEVETKRGNTKDSVWVKQVENELKEAQKKIPLLVDEVTKELYKVVDEHGQEIADGFKIDLPKPTADYDEYVKDFKLAWDKIKELQRKANADGQALFSENAIKDINATAAAYEEMAKALALVDPKKQGGNTDSMFEERLRVLREMYDAYSDLNKTLDETKSKEGVIAKYGDAFKQAFGVDLKDSIFDPSFFINDDEYIKALDKLLKLTADAKEKLKVQLEKGRVEWDIILDAKMASDAKLNEQVEKMFSDYSSSIELDKMDISPEFAKAFFDIDTTSLEDLKKKLQDLQPKFQGQDMVKQYEEYLKKVEELEVKAQQERLKEYLKYTRDAIGERAKLKLEELQKLSDIEQTFNKAESDKNAQIAKLQEDKPSGYETEIQKLLEEIKLLQSARQQAKKGVHEETETAIQKLEWEQLKSSDILQSLYSDLENTSKYALGNMIDMLEKYRDQWTKLPINEMKEVINLLDKMKDAQAQKDIEANPWESARTSREKIEKYGGVDKAQSDLVMFESEIAWYNDEISQLEYINQLMNEKKDVSQQIQEYNAKYGRELTANQNEISKQQKSVKEVVKGIQKEAKAAEDIVDENKNLSKSYQKQAEYLGIGLKMAQDLYDAFSDLYEALGGEEDSPVAIFADMGMSMAETVIQTIMLQLQLQAASIAAEGMGAAMNSAMGIIGWIVMAIQLIVKLITAIVQVHDNNLQKQIDDWAEGVEYLEKKYEHLEKTIENALSFETYRDTFEEMQDNLQAQIENTNKMIKAERDKKKTDDDQIKEWQEQIEEDQKKLLEIQEQFYEDMGVFGSAENYKSAAEDFIDAWYSAFKETGNGLEGLKEQWDEYFDNIIKKQILMRAGEKYIQPLLDEVDKAVGESGEITSSEMEKLRRMAEETSVGLNEVLTNLAENLGGFGTSASGELEGLSKGIQGITETTAQALEAILNSMRLYVIDNNKQLTEIAERVLNFENPQNPILAELKQQTEYIEEIRTFLNSVISRQGNPSIRVTM